MITEGEKLRRGREIELKRRDKARLRELAGRIKLARRGRTHRIRELRGLCRIGRQNLRARIRALRSETLDRLREKIQSLRAELGTQCGPGIEQARGALEREISAAHNELAEARRLFRSTYGRKNARVTAKERHEESTDEVERNLPAELVPVWRKIHRSIKAGPRRTRTEAFLEWVEDNTEEAHRIVYDQVEKDVAAMLAEHEAVSKRLKKTRGYEKPEAQASALAGGVPF